MSLVSMPFVDTSADVVLHSFSFIVLVVTVAAVAIGFWKVHELPVKKAHRDKHHQIGLITVLTWIGFMWHWVWVLAVLVAFVDGEKALIRIRDIWLQKPTDEQGNQSEVERKGNA